MKYRVLIGINFPKAGGNGVEQRAEPGEVVDLGHLSETAMKFYAENHCIEPIVEDETEGGN